MWISLVGFWTMHNRNKFRLWLFLLWYVWLWSGNSGKSPRTILFIEENLFLFSSTLALKVEYYDSVWWEFQLTTHLVSSPSGWVDIHQGVYNICSMCSSESQLLIEKETGPLLHKLDTALQVWLGSCREPFYLLSSFRPQEPFNSLWDRKLGSLCSSAAWYPRPLRPIQNSQSLSYNSGSQPS